MSASWEFNNTVSHRLVKTSVGDLRPIFWELVAAKGYCFMVCVQIMQPRKYRMKYFVLCRGQRVGCRSGHRPITFFCSLLKNGLFIDPGCPLHFVTIQFYLEIPHISSFHRIYQKYKLFMTTTPLPLPSRGPSHASLGLIFSVDQSGSCDVHSYLAS